MQLGIHLQDWQPQKMLPKVVTVNWCDATAVT